jgi:hypothetical protein
VHRALLRVALAFAFLLSSGTVLHAQREPTLEIRLPAADQLTKAGPLVTATDMLSSPRARDPLAAGFPARFHFVVSLWSEGKLANTVERRAEYDVLVRFLAMEKKYEVIQNVNDHVLSLGKFDHVEDAEGAIAHPTRAPIRAFSSRKHFYYRVTLDVQVLGASDLDEVNGWLKGELKPAIKGDRDPGTALTRTIRYLTSRLLGGDSREFEAQTPVFETP